MEKKEKEFIGFDENDQYLNPDDFNETDLKEEDTKADKKEDDVESKETVKEDKPEEIDNDVNEKVDAKSDDKVENKVNKDVDEEAEKQKKKNSYFAEQRRLKETKEREDREKKIEREATLKAELGMVKENPYTSDPITDEEDLRIYKIQKEIDDAGGDPINDLPKKLAEIRRKENAELKAKNEEEAKLKDQVEKDVADFHKAYPKVDLNKLSMDEEFQNFSADKYGRWTMAEIYEAYVSKKNNTADLEKKQISEDVKKALDDATNNINKIPSTHANGGKTQKSFLDMTDEEYIKWENENNKDFF